MSLPGRTDDKHVKEAFAAAKAAYDRPELRAENELLRTALLEISNQAGDPYNEGEENVGLLKTIERLADAALADAIEPQPELRAENERLREALERVRKWTEAYPLDIFPEPDWRKARALLEAGGMTLDSVSAGAMRRVVDGLGKIVRDVDIEAIERGRAALQDAKDLAIGDAPAHMIVDVCDRALSEHAKDQERHQHHSAR